jgi:PAS domain S-box-containing protein
LTRYNASLQFYPLQKDIGDMGTTPAEAHTFLAAGGKTGALMRAHDWSGVPLGPPELWPQSLRSVVGLLLGSKFPMFVAWGPELNLLYNDSYAEILGNKHPMALGSRFQDVWPEIWDDINPFVAEALKGNPSYHENISTTAYRQGRGTQAWFTFSYSPTRNESGQVAGVFCVVVETTSQLLAERHLNAEYERMRGLFQQAPGLIAVLREPNHLFEIANDAFLQLIGHRDVLGKSVRAALPEIADQGFLELLDNVYLTGKPFIAHEAMVKLQRHPEGPLEERFVNFVYQPTFNYVGEITGIFIEGNDVTEAVRASQALRESEEQLRQLANTIPQLAWIANPEGSVHWYNDRWYEYTGMTFEEMQGWGWEKVHHPDRLFTVIEEWKASIASGQQFEMSFPMRAANGEYHTFFSRAAPLRDATGKIVHWFGTNTDVTPLENAQNELAMANRRKDEFLAMLAHELRNPLAPIATAAELLKLTTYDEARVRKTSNVISRQVAHMTELVDDLLDVSRVTRGLVTLQEETLNISSVLADAIEQTHGLMETKRHHFTVLVPEEQFIVKGDRTRLIQVFSNLLNNAAKFTPPEGNITLRLKANEAQVEVTVEDNGIGVAPFLQPHIFDLFTQAERTPDRAQGGLGIGLALVKSLVELQGGKVSMHSEGAGKGSVFSVSLPRKEGANFQPEGNALKSRVPQTANAAQVLIVDDNQDAADTLALLLQTLGHEVAVSYNPLDALALAKRTSPAVLLVDIGLPDIDGYEVARRLRAMPETARSLLIALTGYGQPHDKEQAIQAGFDHHLVKPVNFSQVVELLANVG